MELEAALRSSHEELESKKKEISLLQKQVTELEQKLQVAGDKLSVKVILFPTAPKHVSVCDWMENEVPSCPSLISM